jgi:hypothetical protein
MRAPIVVIALLALPAAAETYVPPPPGQVPGYSATVMPCRIVTDEGPARVTCKGDLLDGKSLKELAILRNTIFARWGWSGFRKAWLREHFQSQPWFKPNPKFTYKLLSDADRKNAHFIGAKEHSFTESELREMRAQVEKRSAAGKRTPADWIELGLIDRAMGSFAVDEEGREQAEGATLDRILAPGELRKLSLRDLRVLRNTIYARRGRPFKSPLLRKHFEGMSWYKVDAGYTDKRLSANDRRNIALIKSAENEFGGPLRDEDFLIEPAFDGA